jgi:hypothetical protein
VCGRFSDRRVASDVFYLRHPRRLHRVGPLSDRLCRESQWRRSTRGVAPAKKALAASRASDMLSANGPTQIRQRGVRAVVLVRRSDTDTPPNPREENFLFMHGALRVGQICRRQAFIQPDRAWLWAINGVPGGPDPLGLAGTSSTLDDAEAQMNAAWRQWLAWAGLMETTVER